MSGGPTALSGVALAPPVLESQTCVDVQTDVGPMFVHRDDAVITPTLQATGCWEPEEAAFLRGALTTGARFLDVGANVGYFSVMAASIVGPAGRVVAIEPEPRNLDLLRANLWRNRAWNAEIAPLAAHATTCYLGLRLSPENRGDHQVFAVDAMEDHSGSLVPAARLDELLGDACFDVVKVDVQGVDHEVVAGLREVVSRSPGIVLLCEFWLTGMVDRGVDPLSVVAGYESEGFAVNLLATGGAVTPCTGTEAVEACRVGDNDFVNLILTTNDRETRMTTSPPGSAQSSATASPSGTAALEPGVVEQIRRLAEETNDAGGGYHVLRPLPDIVVNGEYDMYPLLGAYRLPDDLTGRSVLDVGTASGFFAMECARRGGSVTAVDLVLWDSNHWAIAELMGWDVRRVQMDIYDLDETLGQFDLVICGSLLLHLPDPVGAIRRLRSVCRGRTIVSTSCPTEESAAPLCEFVGERREGGAYWAYWNIGSEALRRMLLAADFSRVENQNHFTLEPVPEHPHKWSIYHAVAHGVV
jgi:FkbM family methyltransferase